MRGAPFPVLRKKLLRGFLENPLRLQKFGVFFRDEFFKDRHDALHPLEVEVADVVRGHTEFGAEVCTLKYLFFPMAVQRDQRDFLEKNQF